MPSRFDADEVTPLISTLNRQFASERVIAYEVGYRTRPVKNVTLSVAAFYNRYNNVHSLNYNPDPPTVYVFENDYKSTGYGFEIFGKAIISSKWRLRGGYSFLRKTFTSKSPMVVEGAYSIEAIDPNNQAVVQSILDLPHNIELDITGRYVDVLNASLLTSTVPAYLTFDLRLGWQYKSFNFSVVGKNLSRKAHPEFGMREIPRSIYQMITFSF